MCTLFSKVIPVKPLIKRFSVQTSRFIYMLMIVWTWHLAVIFLQIGTCESQDSLALKIMSPVVNLWVPYQITYYSVRITNDDIKKVG